MSWCFFFKYSLRQYYQLFLFMVFINPFIKSYGYCFTHLLINNLLLYIIFFFFCPSFIILLPVSLSLCYSQIILIVLWWFFIAFNGMINFSSNPGWNILIWRNWILLFQLWLGIWMWLMQLSVFCYHRTVRSKR